MSINILFHIDELARDSIVASALKREGIKQDINVYFTTKKQSKILRILNPFDAIILPSLEHFKFSSQINNLYQIMYSSCQLKL